MSLIGALNIGKSALAAHQAAIQVTSNNISNAGNPDYTRQVARISPNPDHQLKPGAMIGTGVTITGIDRQIDQALEERIRGSISDSESAGVSQQWLGRVEAVFNGSGEDYLSNQLTAFFDSWSQLANTPQDEAKREIVVNNAQSLANTVRSLKTQLDGLKSDIRMQLSSLATDANSLADKIAKLNQQIVSIESSSGGTANSLRDQRDANLKSLAKLVDIKTSESENGDVTVTVGGETLVAGNINRGIIAKESLDGQNHATVLAVKADGSTVNATSGQAGALVGLRDEIGSISDKLDTLVGNLIFQVNHLHSQGQGIDGYSQVISSNSVADPNTTLDSDAAGLAFKPVNGSFQIQVRRKSDGGVIKGGMVQVDLDGLGADDSLNSLATKINNSLPDVIASVIGGKLKIEAVSKSDMEVTFSEDHSYVLAALGINSFFSGTGAADVAVIADVQANSSLIAAAKNGSKLDNTTAQEIFNLQTKSLADLGNVSIKDSYDAIVTDLAVSAAGARSNAEAAQVINETLSTQREALSGVSLDEEAINLMQEQRAYQAAARVVSAIDEMMQTLLQMV
ncbi:MAG: flagellar hook-associated protein FlgK [Planctomycetota bacterium]|nr:flagellar hook-associated protein FlgK [Planctomycetota bacterium]